MTNSHHMNKSKSPSPKDDLIGPRLAEIGPVDLKKKIFFSIFQCIFTFSLLSPLGNDRWSSFEQI
jgi:hypothetical protein